MILGFAFAFPFSVSMVKDPVIFLVTFHDLGVHKYLSTAKQGDNVIGSVRPSVCPSSPV